MNIKPIVISVGDITDLALRLVQHIEIDEPISEKSMLVSTRLWLEEVLDGVLYNAGHGEQRDLWRFKPIHFCDMPNCEDIALKGDLFCKEHQAQEDRLAAPVAKGGAE